MLTIAENCLKIIENTQCFRDKTLFSFKIQLLIYYNYLWNKLSPRKSFDPEIVHPVTVPNCGTGKSWWTTFQDQRPAIQPK